MRKLQNFTLLFALVLFAVNSSSQPVNIKVFPEIPQQKIVSIGGNYCQANYTSNAWDAVGEATLTEFRPSHVRLALPLQFRGQEYATYKGSAINLQPAVVSLLETMQTDEK
jgi:hypothetical protein